MGICTCLASIVVCPIVLQPTPSSTSKHDSQVSVLLFMFCSHTRTGGNQREMDRAKAAKKQAALNKSKPKQSNTTLAKRKEADAEILRAKQKKRDEEKAAEGPAAKAK
ncbi:hypothetical protein F5I97DRAFT_1634595 [Phlebopus sp. FC_14]|nr:hypothetical protein F5I97DRAFT_1634595 [Phlebopus sp. FC_14]